MLEERDAPNQLIFRSMDPDFCVVLSLAVHFEYSLEAGIVHKKTQLFGLKREVLRFADKAFQQSLFPLDKGWRTYQPFKFEASRSASCCHAATFLILIVDE